MKAGGGTGKWNARKNSSTGKKCGHGNIANFFVKEPPAVLSTAGAGSFCYGGFAQMGTKYDDGP